LLSTGKVFEKVILQIVKRQFGENNLLTASQFEFRARHNTTLKYMRLADHVTLKVNNNMSTAAVFLDIEKAFDTIWHPGLPYKLSNLKFSASLIKLISSFYSQRQFRVSVEGEISTPRCKQGCHKVPSYPLLYTIYILIIPPKLQL
jgi:hypothetical protein